MKGGDFGFWQKALKSQLAPNLHGTRIDDFRKPLVEAEGKKPRKKSAANSDRRD